MTKQKQVAVVAVAFPAQGHLNQLLNLSLLLSHDIDDDIVGRHRLRVHFACTATHNRQARLRLQGWDSSALRRITFHDLDFPPFPSPPPDPESGDKFPSHLQPLFDSSANFEEPLSSLLRTITTEENYHRVVIIHDALLPFAGHLTTGLDIDSDSFCLTCLSGSLSFPFALTSLPAEGPPEGTPEFLLSPPEGCASGEFIAFLGRQIVGREVPNQSVIINTSRAIEGEILDLLSRQPYFHGRKIFAVGPFHPISPPLPSSRHRCLEWLDEQPPESVLYVSFGSTTTMSAADVEQLEVGLRRSGHRFLWVQRDADRGDIFSESCTLGWYECELNRDGETEAAVGMVVRGGWAPQLEILGHRATAAFMSHCGWNSCIEAMSTGVPILAWPMHCDQPVNGKMIADHLKTGYLMREWGRRREVVPATAISKMVRKVMAADDGDGGGNEVRARAKELGEAIRSSVSKGGSSHAELVSLVAHITRP